MQSHLTSATFSCPARARRRAVLAEVFLAAIAQPDPQHLRDPFLLGFGQAGVQSQRPFALDAAGAIAMPVPVRPRQPDAPGGFFDQSHATQIGIVDFAFFCHRPFAIDPQSDW